MPLAILEPLSAKKKEKKKKFLALPN